jgi:GNAT superfamily N-acetyltransferase
MAPMNARPPMQIREAQVEDAPEACRLLRRSIAELCRADHRDDPDILEQWLRNKTVDNVRNWITMPQAHVFVATEGAVMVGVAAVTSHGEITLNYVSPDARFRGVSKAMLDRLEARARELGNDGCVLTSTATARGLYLSAGYEEQEVLDGKFGKAVSYRMSKRLPPAAPAR